jgi:hypothetical protein
MQPRPSEEITLSFPQTDSFASFLSYMQRRFSNLVALDAPIPALLREHQSEANVRGDSSSALDNGMPRTMFDTLDVINQHTFTESPPLRRAG